MNSLEVKLVETVLKTTVSRCHICRHEVPAQVIKVTKDGREQVVMRRTCSCHGTYDFTISSDARFYWLAKGNPNNESCGCGTTCSSVGGGAEGFLGKNARDESQLGVIEKLSSCVVLIEIVDSCNLACPTCFADSPVGVTGSKLKSYDFENITRRIQGILDLKGEIEILQFSGGEPTLHPEFFRLVEWVRSNHKIKYLLINTNGVRLAKDEGFVEEMGRMFQRFDNIQIYLQFDGPQEAGQIELRGTDLRSMRDKAIRNCERIGLPITLAMTVNDDNLNHVWNTIEYALPFKHIRGVTFQPMFSSGRVPTKKLFQPVTPADIILGLNEQSSGTMLLEDFTPLPCGDPNCATIGWLFRRNGNFYSPTKYGGVDIAALQATIADKINYNLEELEKCGCDNTELGDMMKQFEMEESNAFRVMVKPFMGAESWDQDRIDRCCTHVIRPDGKLDSFCRYYFGTSPETTCC